MDETSVIQNKIDIAQELSDKNYEKLIGYADEIQKEVIHHWQTKDNRALEGLILKSRNILNFWTDHKKEIMGCPCKMRRMDWDAGDHRKITL